MPGPIGSRSKSYTTTMVPHTTGGVDSVDRCGQSQRLEAHNVVAIGLSVAEDLGKLCSADTRPMSYPTRVNMDETASAGGVNNRLRRLDVTKLCCATLKRYIRELN